MSNDLKGATNIHHLTILSRTAYYDQEIPYFNTQAVLKFPKLNTRAQQREAVVQGRSLSPYRPRYNNVTVNLYFVPLKN
ncbi:MAG: hypothetical protein LBJ00_10350 [Planctomycetaceae bacterium]|nr:hypothetical protein [Planctomycetaceae bacterium]